MNNQGREGKGNVGEKARKGFTGQGRDNGGKG